MIIRNAIRCLECGDIIESLYRHNYVTCFCGKVAVDGGHDYLRRIGDRYEDLYAVSTKFEEIRKHIGRFGYGKPGAIDYGRPRYTVLADMTDEHLEASLVYPGVTKGGAHWLLLLEEKLYRAENEIAIYEKV